MFENYFELDISTLYDPLEKSFEIFQECSRCRDLEEKLEDVNEELDRMKDIVHDRSRYHSLCFYFTLQGPLKSCLVFYERDQRH